MFKTNIVTKSVESAPFSKGDSVRVNYLFPRMCGEVGTVVGCYCECGFWLVNVRFAYSRYPAGGNTRLFSSFKLNRCISVELAAPYSHFSDLVTSEIS